MRGALLICFLLAGCASAPGPSDAAEPDDGPDAAEPRDPGRPLTPGTPAAPDSQQPHPRLEDCLHLDGVFAVDYDKARALVPEALEVASWIAPGDQTVASARLQLLQCAATDGLSDDGPVQAAIFNIHVEPEDPSDSIDLHPIYVVSDRPDFLDAWSGAGFETAAGTLDWTVVEGQSSVQIVGDGLTMAVTGQDTGATTGSISDRLFYHAEARTIVAGINDMRGSFPAAVEVAAVDMPADVAVGPFLTAVGLSGAQGEMDSIRFEF